MNVLITSAGRRIGLISAFLNTFIKEKYNGKVYTTDLNPKYAPVSYFTKCFKVGKFSQKNYIKTLISICLKNKISVVIPTIDSELKLLASNKDLFTNNRINLIISSPELIDICSDKEKSKLIFDKLKIRYPKIQNKNSINFPVFVKPKFGSNSKGIYQAREIDDIPLNHLKSSNFIFQDLIDNNLYDEYTLDLFFNKKGLLVCCVPRIRLKVVGGESNQGITKKKKFINLLKEKFKSINGFKGCITLQLFVNKKDDNDIYGIEINPRFGGGYPFSYNAGANFPKMILDEYIHKKELKYSENWISNCINIRYEKEIIINE